MKAAIAAVLVTLLFGASAVEASWYPKKRLPRALDSPRLRPKLKESHKPGNHQKHPKGPMETRLTAPGAVNA